MAQGLRFDMRLVVPHIYQVEAVDARLIRLAEFLGVSCELLRLAKGVQQFGEYLETAVQDQNSCLVVNPLVMREWVGGDVLPAELVASLMARFRRLIMHALTLDPFVAGMVAAVSGGKLQSVQPVSDAERPYEISPSSKDICGPFAGLSFGPINAANDHVLAVCSGDSTVQQLICIGGRPHMAAVKRNNTEILFLATEDTADINTEICREPMRDYFSRLLPQAMALRHVFGEQCWRPSKLHA
jgi:hypothetical protein